MGSSIHECRDIVLLERLCCGIDCLRPHALREITGCVLLSPKRAEDDTADIQTNTYFQMDPTGVLQNLVRGRNALQQWTLKLEMYLYQSPVWWSRVALHLFKSENPSRGPDGRTDGHILLLLRGFEPMAFGHMHCSQLQAARMNYFCRFKAVFPDNKSDIIYIYIRFILGPFMKKLRKNYYLS